MPGEDRVGRHDRGDRLEDPATERTALPSETAALGVGEPEPRLPELRTEDPILLEEVVDHAALVTVHPAGEDGGEEGERRARAVHPARVSSPDYRGRRRWGAGTDDGAS